MPPPIGKFCSQKLVREERGFYLNAAPSGRMADPCLKAHVLWGMQRKTQPSSARPKPKAASEFLRSSKVPSFGNHKWPLSGHPSSSAFLPVTVEPQAPS